MVMAKTWMMDAISVYQHHDAITGTDQQFVANDYTYRLQNATDINNILYADLLKKKLSQ
jgi:hypothetical protein